MNKTQWRRAKQNLTQTFPRRNVPAVWGEPWERSCVQARGWELLWGCIPPRARMGQMGLSPPGVTLLPIRAVPGDDTHVLVLTVPSPFLQTCNFQHCSAGDTSMPAQELYPRSSGGMKKGTETGTRPSWGARRAAWPAFTAGPPLLPHHHVQRACSLLALAGSRPQQSWGPLHLLRLLIFFQTFAYEFLINTGIQTKVLGVPRLV